MRESITPMEEHAAQSAEDFYKQRELMVTTLTKAAGPSSPSMTESWSACASLFKHELQT